ncbi:MAG: GGDEF domain-containing protein [Methylophilus sp.]|nr:GGDEF domain-containing protein [Methylophilus sp.]
MNDSFGHASGDVVLSRLANLLKINLRDSDLLCRFGGEEFAVLLPNTVGVEAEEIANQIKRTMMNSTIVLAQENLLSITASFGVSDTGETLEDLLSHADKAMYLAKNNGRNSVMVYQV